jgi:hypothetical protein
MLAFMGFVLAGQATGKGPLAALGAHLSDPFGSNIAKNIGTCTIPSSIDVQGLTIPLSCECAGGGSAQLLGRFIWGGSSGEVHRKGVRAPGKAGAMQAHMQLADPRPPPLLACPQACGLATRKSAPSARVVR